MGVDVRRWRVAVAVALVLLPAGCSIGDVRRTPPSRPSAVAEPTPTGSARTGPDETREAKVPVPPGYLQQNVEFTDAAHGYALFGKCDATGSTSCPTVLFATSDGGRSWSRSSHPESEVVAGHRPTVDRYRIDRNGRLVEVTADGSRPMPVQPPVPGFTEVAYRWNWILVAGMRDRRLHAAISTDSGRTWRTPLVPAPDPRLVRWRIELSVDGDAWLLGYLDDRGTAPAQIWYHALHSADGWLPVPVTELPERVAGTAAIGTGMLLVAGSYGIGVAGRDGHYHDPGWPVSGGVIRVLDDGTLFTRYAGVVWLGEGRGTQRRWIKIILPSA